MEIQIQWSCFLSKLVAVIWFATSSLSMAQQILPEQAREFNAIEKMAQGKASIKALDSVEKYVKKYPRDAQARFIQATLLSQLDKTQAAIDALTAMTQEFPELPEPYNNLAALYAKSDQYEKARQFLEKAIRLNPSYAVAHGNLGDIYAKLSNRSYTEALRLAPSAPYSPDWMKKNAALQKILMLSTPQVVSQKKESSVNAKMPDQNEQTNGTKTVKAGLTPTGEKTDSQPPPMPTIPFQ